jgi:hypothetical protein
MAGGQRVKARCDTTGTTGRRQAKASKCKWMKAKLLSFPFIYFSESRLFKGLRRKKIKKSAAGLNLPRWLWIGDFQTTNRLPLRRMGGGGFG